VSTDVDPKDPTEGLDKRRNRVTDPGLQNAFLGGVNEGRPAEDAIGQQKTDDPTYAVIWSKDTDDGGSEEFAEVTQSIERVLDLVKKALTGGYDVTVKHGQRVIPEADIIDAEVVED